jgi:hypothetical protein
MACQVRVGTMCETASLLIGIKTVEVSKALIKSESDYSL